MDNLLAKQKLLVIAPHADDEVFGCAGTMAKIKDLGGQVYVILLSVGDVYHYGNKVPLVTGKTREQEFERCMKFLGVDDYEIVFTESEKCLRLDVIPRRDLIALLERDCRLAIDKIKPTMIALPAISYNQDHEAVFRAGFTACRPSVPEVKPLQKIVLAYHNTALSWSMEREKFHPNFYVDISDYLEQKMKALAIYESQLKPSCYHASLENVRNLTLVCGREVSVYAAEPYMCLRFVI